MAPTATIVGDVTIGADSRVMFGAVVTAQGGPVLIGAHCIGSWGIQQQLDFPGTVFGLKRAEEGQSIMPELTRRYAKALGRHRGDRLVDD